MENSCPVALDTTGQDLHGEAARLRSQGPTQVTLPGGVVVWSINSHDAIKQILSDPNVTKSARNHWPAFINGEIPPNWEMISWIAMDNMVTAYGKDLLRLRRLVGKAFSPRRVELTKPLITGIATKLLDALGQVGTGETVDLRQAYCYPLPALLVADLIGMDEQALAKTAVMIEMMVDTTVTPEQAQATLAGWRQSIADLIESKRANPGEDITSDLIAARDEDGSRLTEAEMTDGIFAILGAGSETTINFMGNAIRLLLDHPAQLALLTSGQVSWNELIDEVLRVDSPLAHLPLRYAVTDVVVEGVRIPQGDPILLNYCSVGRDPALHGEDADVFDIQRADKTHLTFGHGPHYCLGLNIAKAVGQIGLTLLFERFPDLNLAVASSELQHLPTFIMNGQTTLPVRLTAAEAKVAA